MLTLHKRGKKGLWQIKGTINGERYRESTGTTSRTHAQAILAKRQSQILDRTVFGEERTSILAEAMELYIKQGGEKRFLEPLLQRWGELRIADISQAEVTRGAHELYPGRTAAWHVRAVYTPLNAIIRQAHRAGMCELRVFEKPKVKTVPVQYADDRWFEVALPHCRLRLASIMLFMTLTAARVQEACDLVWRDVDLLRREAQLRKTKNNTARRVVLPPVVLQALRLLADEYGQKADERVFGYASRWSVNQAIARACKRAGLPYLSSHKVGRHAFAARLLRQGHSIKLVQEAGGWKVARMVTDHYGHLEASQVDDALSRSGDVFQIADMRKEVPRGDHK
jgi:integrase